MSVGTKPFRLRRGPRRITPVGAAERRAGYVVLAVLAAVLAYFLVRQGHFSPAVVAALDADKAKAAKTSRGDSGALTALAGALESLPGAVPLAGAETFGPDTLSDKIDGKAELYLSSGFKEMACRAFAPTGGAKARLDVYVYEMNSPDSAFAAFSGQRRTGAAHSGLTPNAYATGNALFAASGPYYLEVVADSDAEPVRALLEPMGAALLARLGGQPGQEQGQEGTGSESSATAIFPKPGLIADSLRLTKADAFGLEGFVDVYTADYQVENGEATAFASRLTDTGEATAWRDKYVTFLVDNGYAVIEAPDAPRGAAVLELSGAFEIVMQRGPVLYGVHEATSRPAALALARASDALAREKVRE